MSVHSSLWSSWRRSVTLALLVCLSLGVLSPRARTEAAPATVAISLLDGRVGLLHLTANGLPADTVLTLMIVVQPLTLPSSVVQYLQETTTATGTLDVNDLVGVFMCGTYVQVLVQDPGSSRTTFAPQVGSVTVNDSGVIAQSAPLLGQCIEANPLVGVVAYSNGLATVSGEGFYPMEMTALTITSTLLGVVGSATTQTNTQGVFTLPVAVGTVQCGDTLTVSATGGAGSTAQGAYTLPCPPTPTATPSPPPPPRQVSTPVVPTWTAPRLVVTSGPRTIGPHQLETILVQTGLPHALVRVTFNGAHVASLAFTVRANDLGVARITYLAPRSLAAPRVTVRYAVRLIAGSRILDSSNTFVEASD